MNNHFIVPILALLILLQYPCKTFGMDFWSSLSKTENNSWEDIKKKKKIRAYRLAHEEESRLPRQGISSLYHFDLFESFAAENQIDIEWIRAKNLKEMIDGLNKGYADIVPRHLTITENRKSLVEFTRPLKYENEILIGLNENIDIKQKINIHLNVATAFETMIRKEFPHWEINYFSNNQSPEDILEKIVSKEIQFSVMDESVFREIALTTDKIKATYRFNETQEIAWAIRKDNSSLLSKLNQFIQGHLVADNLMTVRTNDLNELKEKKYSLRMITRNSAETYFLAKGELMGFEYDLIKEFAKRKRLRLEVIVAETFDEMVELLNSGKGDLIAAGMTRTQVRKQNFNFSIRYNRVNELLIANKKISNLNDLKNKKLMVRKKSAFWTQANRLKEKYGVNLVIAPEYFSTEMLVDMVDRGALDLTIVDSNLFSIESQFRKNIYNVLTLQENLPYAYGVRKNNPQLLTALNQFIQKEYRQTFYNVVKSKYFTSMKRMSKNKETRIDVDGALSPYDDIVQQEANKFHFDWRLITSQMYKESRFNPNAKSNTGAVGLMQVLPKTAKELGYKNLINPQIGIAAGVAYLDWTMQRFGDKVPHDEKIYFALAAYNAGFGHVKDAQKIAKQRGLNPNKWFNNVEKAMLLLQQPQYYKKARFGYCRGIEPVEYVRDIIQRYRSYVAIAK